MRPLIVHAEESWLRSVQLTLDAHGIRHVDSVATYPGESVLKYPNGILVDELDYPEAVALVERLQRSPLFPAGDRRSGRRVITGFILVALAIIILPIILAHFWVA